MQGLSAWPRGTRQRLTAAHDSTTAAGRRQQRQPTRIAIRQRTTATWIPRMTSAIACVGRERRKLTGDTEAALMFTVIPWPRSAVGGGQARDRPHKGSGLAPSERRHPIRAWLKRVLPNHFGTSVWHVASPTTFAPPHEARRLCAIHDPGRKKRKADANFELQAEKRRVAAMEALRDERLHSEA